MSINNVGGVRADIMEMIGKMREVKVKSPALSQPQASQGFGDVFAVAKTAFNHVNSAEANTEAVKNAFLTGEGNVSMSQVIVAAEKSKLAFAGLVTVRNKILEAYKDIMNMPV